MASGLKGALLRKGTEMLMRQLGGSSRRQYSSRGYGARASSNRAAQGQELFNQARQLFGEFTRSRRRRG